MTVEDHIALIGRYYFPPNFKSFAKSPHFTTLCSFVKKVCSFMRELFRFTKEEASSVYNRI